MRSTTLYKSWTIWATVSGTAWATMLRQTFPFVKSLLFFASILACFLSFRTVFSYCSTAAARVQTMPPRQKVFCAARRAQKNRQRLSEPPPVCLLGSLLAGCAFQPGKGLGADGVSQTAGVSFRR